MPDLGKIPADRLVGHEAVERFRQDSRIEERSREAEIRLDAIMEILIDILIRLDCFDGLGSAPADFEKRSRVKTADEGQAERQRDMPPPGLVTDSDLLEAAWGLIANAHGGDFGYAPTEWREAAERWRDAYHNRPLRVRDESERDVALYGGPPGGGMVE